MLIKLFLFFRNKCPEPESNQRHEDFQSSALPTELSGHSSGNRIWTCDLRVMSPTSFQTAPPRVINFVTTINYCWKADDRTRTDNLLITNQLLCQLSHIGLLNEPFHKLFNDIEHLNYILMGGEGFEPSKAVPTDLQSAPFGHSGIHPWFLWGL